MNQNTFSAQPRIGALFSSWMFARRASRLGRQGGRTPVFRLLTLLATFAALLPSSAAGDLAFTSEPPLEAVVNQPYRYTMTAADREDDDDRRGPPPRFQPLELPAWLKFDRDTLSGTPQGQDVGSHTVRLVARRRAELDFQTFTIEVRPASATPPPAQPPPSTPPPQQPPPPAPRATADLEASISVSPNPVLIGAAHAWTLRVRNLGNTDVANLELSALVTAAASYRIDNVSDAGCAPAAAATIVCRWSGLAASGTRTVTLQGNASEPGEVEASAAVSIVDPSPIDPEAGNDRATAVLSVSDTPTVRPAQTLSAGGARDLAAADFDGDGRDDLVVASSDGLLVFLNSPDDRGRPFSAAPLSIASAAGANAVAAAELDGDGGVDVVVAPTNAASTVLFNTNAGDSAPVVLEGSEGALAVAVGDVDGDSLLDVVLGSSTGTSVHRNLGARRFAAPEVVATLPASALAVTDFTGDGRAEIVIGSDGSDTVVYRREASGYALAATVSARSPSAFAVADVDADAVPDLAVGSRSAADALFLTRRGGALSFASGAALGESATVDVLLADFDADGKTDAATIGASGVHRIHRNDGAAPPGFALEPQRVSGARNPLAAVHGSFDFDDIPDLAVATAGGVEIFLNVGRPLQPGAPRLVLNGDATMILTVGDTYTDPGAAAFDDVDGDLTSQIVVTNPVDTKTIGSYVVTYEVVDSTGNKTTATRTVEVKARAAAGGGGGGATGLVELVLLLVASTLSALGTIRLGPHRRARVPSSWTGGWTGRTGPSVEPGPLLRRKTKGAAQGAC